MNARRLDWIVFGTEGLYFQCNEIFYNAELAGGMTRRVLIWFLYEGFVVVY